MQIALAGGKPDRAPIYPIYDTGYIQRISPSDPRDRFFATLQDMCSHHERVFSRHNTDGMFDGPIALNRREDYDVIPEEDHWLVTDKRTGSIFALLDDGSLASVDASGAYSGFEDSRIRCEADIDELLPMLTEEDVDSSHMLGLVEYACSAHPDLYHGYQVCTPMVEAVGACGGFVPALVTMASEPDLFCAVLARSAERQKAKIRPGKRLGCDSIWFTHYYTGADTISPQAYRELIYPFDKEICEYARNEGVAVLDWYLGDLMPVLDSILELPINALILEQGRKGYEIDPVKIRQVVGPKFCLFGYSREGDLRWDRKEALIEELMRQWNGAGKDGAFVVGTTIVPGDAEPEVLDYYFDSARTICVY